MSEVIHQTCHPKAIQPLITRGLVAGFQWKTDSCWLMSYDIYRFATDASPSGLSPLHGRINFQMQYTKLLNTISHAQLCNQCCHLPSQSRKGAMRPAADHEHCVMKEHVLERRTASDASSCAWFGGVAPEMKLTSNHLDSVYITGLHLQHTQYDASASHMDIHSHPRITDHSQHTKCSTCNNEWLIIPLQFLILRLTELLYRNDQEFRKHKVVYKDRVAFQRTKHGNENL